MFRDTWPTLRQALLSPPFDGSEVLESQKQASNTYEAFKFGDGKKNTNTILPGKNKLSAFPTQISAFVSSNFYVNNELLCNRL